MKNMLRLKIIIFTFFIVSCTTYEPIKSNNASDFKYSLDCSGGLLTIQSCKDTAENLCKDKGYDELSRTDSPKSINLSRNMIIQCKK